MADLETVQVVGDGIDGRWVTWRWMNGFLPGGVAEVTGLDRAAARLARALPRDRNHLGFEGDYCHTPYYVFGEITAGKEGFYPA